MKEELPYVYLDEEDKPKKKKKDAKELPYYYVDEEDKPKKKNAKKSSVKSSGKKKKKSKKSGGGGLAVLIVLLVLLLAAGFVYVDWQNICDFGVFDEKIKLPFTDSASSEKVVKTSSTTSYSGGIFDKIDEDAIDDGLDVSMGGTVRADKDLNVTPGLDENWKNILLLGADARDKTEPCRTDTMMICSINTETGEIKLTSLMRDLAVKINGKTTRLNSAFFYGGADLAMSTINQYFGMNIKDYVYVDFNGFANIAEALGGIEMNISEKEMAWINHNTAEQYKILIRQGQMEYADAEAEYYRTELKQYGENIRLNGMQTLGYARIRKLDGGDYERTRRQRDVLNAFLIKLKGAKTPELLALVNDNLNYFKTGLNLSTIVSLGNVVLNSADFAGAEQLRLPVNGTFKEETRNNESMLYDMDIEANTRALYAFIYN